MNTDGSASPASAPESTSRTLILRACQRDPQAWQRLGELYAPLVYFWCRHAGLRDEDAADVVQEVFATVAARVTQFRPAGERGGFRAWLRAITHNKIGDHLRRVRGRPVAEGGTKAQQRMQAIAADEATLSTSPPEPEEKLLTSRATELLRSEFEDRTWQAFWRVAIEHQGPEDVAQDLGMTVAAVYKAKSRVLCRLRRELDDSLE